MLVPAALLVALGVGGRRVPPARLGRAARRGRGRARRGRRCSHGEVELDRRRAVFVGGLVALAAWSLVSRAWAARARRAPSSRPSARSPTRVSRGAAVLTVPRRRLDELLVGVLAGVGVVSVRGPRRGTRWGAAAAERLELPDRLRERGRESSRASPILLGLGLCTEGPAARRALGAAVCPPAAVVLLLSLSRGAMLAGALGARAAPRDEPRVRRLAPRGARRARVAPSRPSSSSGRSRSRRRGARPARSPGSSSSSRSRPRPPRRAVAPAGSGAAPLRGRTRRRPWRSPPRRRGVALGVAGVVAVRDDRSTPAALQGASGRLLSSSTSYRSDYWAVAVGAVRDRPLTRDRRGRVRAPLAPRARRAALRPRRPQPLPRDARRARPARPARSSPCLLVPLAGARVRRRARRPGRAALAAYAALLAHAALDWDWELPVVTLCTLLLAVVLLGLGPETAPTPPAPSSGRRPRRRRGRLVAVGVDVRLAADATSACERGARPRRRGPPRAAARARRAASRRGPPSPGGSSARPRSRRAASRSGGRTSAGRRARIPTRAGAWLALAFATDGGERRPRSGGCGRSTRSRPSSTSSAPTTPRKGDLPTGGGGNCPIGADSSIERGQCEATHAGDEALLGVVVALGALVTFAVFGGTGLAGQHGEADKAQYAPGQYNNAEQGDPLPQGKVTIRVSVNALPAHEAHGDVVGTVRAPRPPRPRRSRRRCRPRRRRPQGEAVADRDVGRERRDRRPAARRRATAHRNGQGPTHGNGKGNGKS